MHVISITNIPGCMFCEKLITAKQQKYKRYNANHKFYTRCIIIQTNIKNRAITMIIYITQPVYIASSKLEYLPSLTIAI